MICEKLYDLQLFIKIHTNSNFGKHKMRKTLYYMGWFGNSRYWEKMNKHNKKWAIDNLSCPCSFFCNNFLIHFYMNRPYYTMINKY